MQDNKRSLDLKVKFSRTDPGMQMYLYKYLKMFDQPVDSHLVLVGAY